MTEQSLEGWLHGFYAYDQPSFLFFSEVNLTILFINIKAAHCTILQPRFVRLIKATHGHTAVLFTSYKTLNAVYDLVAGDLSGYPLIKMNRSNKNAITQFKESGNGVLFASGSMWEGVDCAGDISLTGKAKRWMLDGRGIETFGSLEDNLDFNRKNELLTEPREAKDTSYLANLKKQLGIL